MPRLEREKMSHPLSVRAPGERIQAEPWSFIILALGLGVTAGLLWQFKPVRKALRLYLMVRRFV